MILSDREIRVALNNRQLIIDPPPPGTHIATSAVDLTLGGQFRRWRRPRGRSGIEIDPSRADFFTEAAGLLEDFSVDEGGAGYIVIRPGELLLGITRERIELPIASRLAARVEGRSSLARLGLGVHVTAPIIHAGFRGQIVLEITHQGSLPLRLRPGLRICQLVIEQLFGTPSGEMAGIFQDQTSVTGQPLD